MIAWQNLVSTALVGTERQPSLERSEPSLAGQILDQIDSSDREAALLKYAAIGVLSRMAGFRAPDAASIEEDLAEMETTPCCSRLAGGILASLFQASKTELIHEWLTLAARRGLRIPPEHLPAALDYGAKHEVSRTAILAVSGKRGAWLARQNPNWAFASRTSRKVSAPGEPEALSKRWETGGDWERIDLLHELLPENRAEARRLIESTWHDDSPQERVAFLTCFRDGLCPDDEPMLEQALDDKRKEARQVAVALLAALPNSSLCRRVFDRARPCLSVKRSFLGGESIEVSLPPTWDASMARDGIEQKPQRNSGYGERAWWLRQMLGLTPVSLWAAELNRAPVQIVKAAAKSGEWRDLLLAGFAESAGRIGDTEWLTAIMRAMLDSSEGVRDGKSPVQLDLSAVPEERFEDLLNLAMTHPTGERSEVALELIRNRVAQWNSSTARLLVRIALSDLTRKGMRTQSTWAGIEIITIAGYRSPPQLVNEFEEQWKQDRARAETTFARNVDDFLDLLRFRFKMRTALDEEGD